MHPFADLHVPQGAIGIHWFEQNAYALKTPRGAIVLIDPYFPHQRPADVFIRPTPPVDEAELPTNYVLLTHRHGDHTNPETLSRIHAAWPQVDVVGPVESIRQVLAETPIDASHTVIIDAAESLVLNGITVYAVYAKPVSGDPAADIRPPDVTHLSYVIEVEGIRVYVSGDAINTFADHDSLVQPLAALKPDIGMITTHPTEGEFPFFEGSVALAQKIGLKAVVPAHYECFAKRTFNPWDWAALFPADGPRPLVIPWNSHIVYQK
jgi:L-ascorbate metabolism protein UlaG (beta-lactamase superfamily)